MVRRGGQSWLGQRGPLEDLPNSVISRTDARIRVYDELQRSHGGRIAGSTTHTERAVPDHFVLGEVTVSTTIVNR